MSAPADALTSLLIARDALKEIAEAKRIHDPCGDSGPAQDFATRLVRTAKRALASIVIPTESDDAATDA